MITSFGFSINIDKYREQSTHYKQVVTGITVNKNLNVDRSYIKSVRKYLYLWKRYGYDKANFYYNKEQIICHKQPSNLVQSLNGKIDFIGQVKGKDSKLYLKLLDDYFRIRGKKINEINIHKNSDDNIISNELGKEVTLDRSSSNEVLPFVLSTTATRIAPEFDKEGNRVYRRDGEFVHNDQAILSQFAYSGLIKPGDVIIYKLKLSKDPKKLNEPYLEVYAIPQKEKADAKSTSEDLIFVGSINRTKNLKPYEQVELYNFFNRFKDESDNYVEDKVLATTIGSIGQAALYMTPKDTVVGIKEVFGELRSDREGEKPIEAIDSRIKFATIKDYTGKSLDRLFHVVPEGITRDMILNIEQVTGFDKTVERYELKQGTPVAFIPKYENGELKYQMYVIKPKSVRSNLEDYVRSYNEMNNTSHTMDDLKEILPKNHPVLKLVNSIINFTKSNINEDKAIGAYFTDEAKRFFRFFTYKYVKSKQGDLSLAEANARNIVTFNTFRSSKDLGISLLALTPFQRIVKITIPVSFTNDGLVDEVKSVYITGDVVEVSKKRFIDKVVIADDMEVSGGESFIGLKPVGNFVEVRDNSSEVLNALLPVLGDLNFTINQQIHKASQKAKLNPNKRTINASTGQYTGSESLEGVFFEDIIKYNIFDTNIQKNPLVASAAYDAEIGIVNTQSGLGVFQSGQAKKTFNKNYKRLSKYKNKDKKNAKNVAKSADISHSYYGSSYGFIRPAGSIFIDLGVVNDNTILNLDEFNIL